MSRTLVSDQTWTPITFALPLPTDQPLEKLLVSESGTSRGLQPVAGQLVNGADPDSALVKLLALPVVFCGPTATLIVDVAVLEEHCTHRRRLPLPLTVVALAACS